MKNKIMIFALLFALLVALVPTSSAYAIDVSGILDVTESQAEQMLDELYIEFNEFYGGKIDNCEYYLEYVRVGNNVQYGRIYSNVPIQYSNVEGGYAPTYYSLYTKNTTHYHCYVLDPSDVTKNITASKDNSAVLMSTDFESGIGFITFSNHDICNELGEVVREKDRDKYTFEEWCTDAGLNCSASSNESDSVIPFWYEPDNYNYIVRKNLTASSTSGVYNVTMIQKTDGAHYPYYFEVNDIGYLGVAGAFSDTSAFTVRNFYYDAEGNGWKNIERFDVSTLPFDNTNVTFYEYVVFIYSDTDIYADREASSIWQAASTEYYNVDIPEPEAPTPTPTTVPSSGAGRPGAGTRPDTGGEATGGGGLDFIINLFTLIWQKICSIPMAVDGYNISLQQIFVYGALVSIVGGFIVKFIFRR